MYSNPNKTGFTQVDHISFDIILPTLKLPAQAIYLKIYRQTIGWKKPADQISLSQFRQATGIKDNGTIIRAITELELRKLITVTRRGTKTNTYSINLDTVLACGLKPQALMA